MTTLEEILKSKLAELFSRPTVVCKDGSIIEGATIGDEAQEALKGYIIALHGYNSIAPLVTARYIGDVELDYTSLRDTLEKYVKDLREQLKDKTICLDPGTLKHSGKETLPRCIKLHGSPKVDIKIGGDAIRIETNISGAQLICGSAEELAAAVKVEKGIAFLAPLYALAMATNDERIYKLAETISQAVEGISIIFYSDILNLADSMGRGTLNVLARSLDNVLQSCSMVGYNWCIEALSITLILLLSTVLVSLPHHMLLLNHDRLIMLVNIVKQVLERALGRVEIGGDVLATLKELSNAYDELAKRLNGKIYVDIGKDDLITLKIEMNSVTKGFRISSEMNVLEIWETNGPPLRIRVTSTSRIDMQLCNRVLVKTAQGYRGKPPLEEVGERLREKGYDVRRLDNNTIMVLECRALEQAGPAREERGLAHEVASTIASLVHGRISTYGGKVAIVLNPRNEQLFKVAEVAEKRISQF